MSGKLNRVRLVGDFIRKNREALNLSQKALGQLLEPPVTTQFISNIERGVTPLPAVQVPFIAKALSASDAEIQSLLEKEYAIKLSERLGRKSDSMSEGGDPSHPPTLLVANKDYVFIRKLYDAYRLADPGTQSAFVAVCENMLRIQKPDSSGSAAS
ncbi:MAG: helix-turn-helix domain-containing protein [Bdellovibrionia bacterium]